MKGINQGVWVSVPQALFPTAEMAGVVGRLSQLEQHTAVSFQTWMTHSNPALSHALLSSRCSLYSKDVS